MAVKASGKLNHLQHSPPSQERAVSTALRVVAEGFAFPEGPCFDREGKLYVVEIRGGRSSRIRPNGAVEVFATNGGGPNGAQLAQGGELVVANNGGFSGREPGRIERVARDGAVRAWITHASGAALNRPNDLGFDAQGNLWFTSPRWPKPGASSAEAPPGDVCFATPDGVARVAHTGLRFPNGIGVSPDGATLVVCETGTGKLHGFPIEACGVLGTPRVVADLGERGQPDGFAFDEAGFILCCGWETGRIWVFAPGDARAVETLAFEDDGVTNVCFGGPEHATLFVTESKRGRVVAREWKRPGMRLWNLR
jgi:gluconolactonase